MKNLKKIGALLLALAMVLGMATVAMADDAGLGQDNDGAETGVYEGNLNTLKIKKSVVVENDLLEAITVAHPAITFTYSAAKADDTVDEGVYLSGVTVTDNASDHAPAVAVTANVKNGVEAAISITSAEIADNTVTLNKLLSGATKAQEVISADATVTITASEYNSYGPGIYRYKLSDTTTDAALVAAGIVRGNKVVEDYFLDVYIGWKDADPTSANHVLEVKGYVLSSKSRASITPITNDKESGFEQVTTDINGKLAAPVTDYTTVDLYKTYNVELQKNVTGAMGDTAHEFPFTLTVSNNGLKYIVVTDDDVDGTTYANITEVREAGTLGNETSVELNHNEKAYIVGLAPQATIGFTETNDTDSVYKVSATTGGAAAYVSVDGATAADNAQNVQKNKTAVIAAAAVTNYNSSATTAATAAYTQNNLDTIYTNNFDTISPTGVVLRFAPYAAMLGATPLFVLLGKKRKEKEDEEE